MRSRKEIISKKRENIKIKNGRVKAKLKFSLCMPSRNMWDGFIYSLILNFSHSWKWVVNFTPGSHTPITGLDALEMRKISSPCQLHYHDPFSSSWYPSHYTYWAIEGKAVRKVKTVKALWSDETLYHSLWNPTILLLFLVYFWIAMWDSNSIRLKTHSACVDYLSIYLLCLSIYI